MKVPAVRQISDRWTKEREVFWVSGQEDRLQRNPCTCQGREVIQQHGGGCSSSLYDGGKAMELTGGGRTDQQRKGCTTKEIFLK